MAHWVSAFAGTTKSAASDCGETREMKHLTTGFTNFLKCLAPAALRAILAALDRTGPAKVIGPCLLGALALLAPGTAARAAGTVTVCGDVVPRPGSPPPAGTLRGALAGGGTVTFALADCTMTLLGTLNITANTTINSGIRFVTTLGVVYNSITLSGGGAVRLFTVAAGATLTLNNLTLSGGSAPGGQFSTGGAILNFGTLNANNTRFLSNSASSQGGAIDNENGAAAYIAGGTFTSNTVFGVSLQDQGVQGQGGAIYNDGLLDITSSAFTLNGAPEAGAIYNNGDGLLFVSLSSSFANNSARLQGFANGGGAIKNVSAAYSGLSAYITESTFTGNSAVAAGGAILNSGDMTVSNCTFSSNTESGAIFGGNGGGAIFNDSGVVTVSGSTFQQNTAQHSNGGGIANVGSTATAQLTISSSTFVSNQAAANGGGVYNSVIAESLLGAGAQVNISTSTLHFNFADGDGGGIYNSVEAGAPPGAFAQATVDSTTLAVNNARSGGGIASFNGALSVTNSTFSGNTVLEVSNANTMFATNFATIDYSTIYGTGAPPLLCCETLTLTNTIVDNPTGAANCAQPVTDGGYNLVFDTSCGVRSANHLLIANPLLLPLANNGGPTVTMGLPPVPPATSPVSPAINAIPFHVSGCGIAPTNVDQRGVPRPLTPGGACDIGAVQHLFVTTPPSGTACNGTYNKTFTGDVTVLSGQSCVFIGGGITGNVQVTPGGYFGLRYATAGGDVEVANAAGVAIGPEATIASNLEVHGLSGDTAQNAVCGSQVNGNLDIHNNDAAVAIGSTDPSVCPGNSVGGNLDVHNNSAATTVDSNLVTGNLTDHNNSGPTEVFNDTVTGNLQCHQNTTITGGQDVAKQLQGQCAGF
jgi:hypothetical protein